MPHKSGFEPKDARIISQYEDDDDDDELDDWSLTTSSDMTPRPRRKKTGTQALVEFLNTTSPEEFQKHSTPKRTSNLFFRRRHKKSHQRPTTTTTSTRPNAPNTIHRKNYIEIISHPLLQREPSTPSLSSNPPVLPSNRTHRESSLYSDSIRYSLLSSSTRPRRFSEYTFGGGPTDTDKELRATERLVGRLEQQEDADAVEAALLQRLERFRLVHMDKPSDTVASRLAVEHVRALQSSSVIPSSNEGQKRKVRHIQVQTMPWQPPKEQETPPSVTVVDHDEKKPDNRDEVEQLQKQLEEERRERRRLQAALDETCDHFEVLSGIAYKKLRELWEEKTHWENACIELRDRLIANNDNDKVITTEIPHSDYAVEEEQERQ